MPSAPIFVDLQGFTVRDKFIVKEVAILRNGNELIHHLFRAPFDWNLLTAFEKSRTRWLTANHHGLRWNSGDVEYHRANTIVHRALRDSPPSEFARIYVKGLEKKGWLKKILGNVVDNLNATIETIDADYDIGRLETLGAAGSFRCGQHAKNCAMENVCKLHNWWVERDARISEL